MMPNIPFPIKYFEQNLIFGIDGTVSAYYELQPFNYDFRSVDEQLDLLGNLETLYWNIQADTHALVVPEFHSLEEHRSELYSQLSPDLGKEGAGFIEASMDHLSGKGVHSHRFYLGIKLKESQVKNGSILADLAYVWKDFKRYLLARSGTEIPEIFEEEIQTYRTQEELFYSRINSCFRVRRVATEDFEWLIRRSFYRGIARTPKRKNWKPEATPVHIQGKKALRPGRDVLTLAEGSFTAIAGRRLEVEQFVQGVSRKGYMAFLTISHIPDKAPFPGIEWLYQLQKLSFPVEASVRTETIEYSKALAQVQNKKKELKAEDEHASESGEDTSFHILNSRQEALELENNLRTDKFPLLTTSIVLCVSATTIEELHMRIQLIKDLYSDMMVQIEVPYGDQWRAFNEFLPGSKRYITDYIHHMDPTAVAAGMFGATRQLGDGLGHFIGMSQNLPVFFQHDRGPKDPRLSTTASAAFIGSLGAGKSLGANLLAYQALLNGSKVLIFDPKDERGYWPELLPELKPISRVVTLRASMEDRGKLDPLSGAHNPTELTASAETAKRILQFLSRAADGTYEAISIGKAVDYVVQNDPKPSMTAVLEALIESNKLAPEKRQESLGEMVDVLQYLATSGQGQLLFGDGSQEAIDLSKPLTILQIEDLQLPEESQTDFGRMGIALLMAISDFSRRFSHQTGDGFKLVLFDESWRLAKVREGRAILEELVRTGRSKNAAIYLISQNAKDLLGEEIRSNLGCRFVFRCRDQREAEAACDILGIEANEYNVERIRNLPTGMCLLSDLEKCVNELEIQIVEERIFHAFDTRPGSNKKKQTGITIERITRRTGTS
ncbi:Archaeal DNA helicase HerA or a related bacterial ATPase, contains HAS-barrel and ATPase domains [Thermoactinomyces sp. DSM 45891]|uniref:ATP-binding protein n=1 Tax=Thermoactinomyces sp. DSM 45891 TaxID=1761907 RepID=UPI00091D725F|nr:ATP-binding protein [Thermoactinomyces sp. DSM 45891]SFX41890.1 Archaeal DNA helicase HerA or a related bacterial ATPase, contains HAS-barrel and ATPase domains [Thermoactinomyces sp. DSM 45891]